MIRTRWMALCRWGFAGVCASRCGNRWGGFGVEGALRQVCPASWDAVVDAGAGVVAAGGKGTAHSRAMATATVRRRYFIWLTPCSLVGPRSSA